MYEHVRTDSSDCCIADGKKVLQRKEIMKINQFAVETPNLRRGAVENQAHNAADDNGPREIHQSTSSSG